MKLIEGSTLADELNRPNSLAERMPLLDAVCRVTEAVSHAHGLGIIHRDIKAIECVARRQRRNGSHRLGHRQRAQTGKSATNADRRELCSDPFWGDFGHAGLHGSGTGKPIRNLMSEPMFMRSVRCSITSACGGVPPYAGLSPSDIILEVQQGHDPTPVSRFVDGNFDRASSLLSLASDVP